MSLDTIDRKLFSLLQKDFPLNKEPYAALGLKLGIGGDEVIRRIEQLKSKGMVRQIAPIIDSRRLGYQPTLVAMRVAEAELERVGSLISEHPGVSHCYERTHRFNVWFTLALPAEVDVENELEQFRNINGVQAAFSLPVVKEFKLSTHFSLDGEKPEKVADRSKPGKMTQEVKLSPTDRQLINELQQDLPLTDTPFSAMAEHLGMSQDDFLARCQSLQQYGIIRRFAAEVNHRQAGFMANAMTCWIVPPEKIEIIAPRLAELSQVSHLYERKTNPLWSYNLFAMIHGNSKEVCQETANQVATETGLSDYVMLFSTREFKKTRVKYLV
ncbi:MAG: AsnC family transcriptional regulator [Dehalococcoidales bacterium]|nr:AsnC family transcriptional regulator [Dehalococcoidales bacterium]